MSTIFKIICREKFFRNGLGGLTVPRKFFGLLFPMHGVHVINFLFISLVTSCSSKKIVQKLKSLQPEPTTDINATNETSYKYPLTFTETVQSHQDYSFETFIIIISIVLLFCSINSGYPLKLLSLLKRSK